MRNLLLILSTLVIFAACNPDSNQTTEAGFITKLGNDTLAVEQFEKTEDGMTAKVVLRSPQTTFSSYDLTVDSLGGIQEMTRTDYPLDEGFGGSGNVVHSVERSGDSLLIEYNLENEQRNFSVPYEEGILPFIDMIHWPFELAFNKAVETGQDSVHQRLLTGSRVSTFIIADIEGDSMTIRHPFRGVMGVRVDGNGNIEHLDAAQTTRKLIVKRVGEVNIEEIGNKFAELDKNGNPFGQLSGAEEAEFSFKNTDFRIEYGSPKKRGRELFGGIVPWGELWRTGANRATHFYTSNDLTFGDLDVPAGEYTLYTIPEQDGGTLIINEQTGQNGTTYNEERDLGRVPLQISNQGEVTEDFTITIEETEEGGELKLIWGETVLSADFTVE